MAFGFRRERGTGRGYVNESNPRYAIGRRLSRRQYDKFIETLSREALIEELRSIEAEGVEAIRRTELELERLAAQLAAERKTRRTPFQAERQGAGQRRYNTALQAYIDIQRLRTGRTIGKREASQSPDFKSVMTELRGKPNLRKNPRIKAENIAGRDAAIERIGGWSFFGEIYRALYGPRLRLTPGYRMDARGRSIMPRGRQRAA